MIRVDPHELECFLTLAEELHFGRTAQRLRLSPPRVSQLIRSLERRVGGTLVARTSRSVRLTPAGEQLRADLVPAWRGVHSALLRARQAASGTAATLTVGQQGTGANELTGEILREFGRLCPDWQVRLVELDFGNQLSALRTGAVDVALARLPVHEPDITVGAVVVREPRALAVWRDHPLATRDRVGLSEIAGEHIFDLPDTAPQYWRDFHAPPITPEGVPLPRRQVVSTPQEVLSLVGAGLGVSPMVECMRRYYARPDIAYVPVADMPHSEVAVIWLTGERRPQVLAFGAAVATVARAHHITDRPQP